MKASAISSAAIQRRHNGALGHHLLEDLLQAPVAVVRLRKTMNLTLRQRIKSEDVQA